MERRRKKPKAETPANNDPIATSELQPLLEAVNDQLLHRMENDDDVIDAYFNTRCHRWLHEIKNTCPRVESGYSTMVKELQQ